MTRVPLLVALVLSAGSVLAALVMTATALLWGDAPASPAGQLMLQWGPPIVLVGLAAAPGLGVLAAAAWVWLWMLHRGHDFRRGRGRPAAARIATVTGTIGVLCALCAVVSLTAIDASMASVDQLLSPLARFGLWSGIGGAILCGGLATVSALSLRATRRSPGSAIAVGAATGGSSLALGYALSAYVSLGMLVVAAIGPPD